MAKANPLGQCAALFSEKHAAVGSCCRKAGAFKARNRLDGGGVRDAEATGNVSRSRLAFAIEQIGDQLDIIFVQRRRLRGACLAKAAAWVPSSWKLAIGR